MQVNIIDVGAPNTHAAKNGRSYQSIEVTYKGDNGQTATKKLMSFSNPSVFNHIKNLTKGDVVDVVTTKDDNGYWQWTNIGSGQGTATAAAATSSAPSTGGKVSGSNYETKEERAARQIYIVRQSSISAAIGTLSVGAKSSPNSADVIKLAKEFEAYVFSKEEAATGPEITDMQDDIPY
jgi:hypothetical protein